MHQSEFNNICKSYLLEGRELLDMSMGIVSKISDDIYEISSVSSLNGAFVAGESFPLENTYCREVVEQKQTIAIAEIDGHRGLKGHPLYEGLPLEAYIGSPILVRGSVWGTINFSCLKIRDDDFAAKDIAVVEYMAKKLADFLEKSL
jgi:GAF domain-containing protein